MSLCLSCNHPDDNTLFIRHRLHETPHRPHRPHRRRQTELSLSIAERYHSPILSCDSRQLYADLKIGTAAPTPEQLARVRHYFIGTLQLTDYYSAAQYEADAMQLMAELFQQHDVLLMTGGSMMYVDAVCKGIDDIPTVDAETRAQVMEHYAEVGLEGLCGELKLLDPEYYAIVDLKNPKRVIHALEICYMTGRTYTSYRTQGVKQRPFRMIKSDCGASARSCMTASTAGSTR